MKKIVSFLILASLLTMCMGLVLACNGETCSHLGGKATCQEKAICDACGKEYGNLGAHEYENYICKYCEAGDPNIPTSITITFDSNGGSPVASKTQPFGTTFDEPNKPILPTKYFLGWFLDKNTLNQKFSFKTKPTKDTTLYAKWVDLTPLADFISEENEGEITLTKYKGNASIIYIPDFVDNKPVTDIGKIFQGNKKITAVYFSEGITSIAGGTLNVGERVEIGQQSAFSDCTALTTVVLPQNLKTIGDVAFNGCTKLSSITIPDSVTSIGIGAFRNCSNLSSINFPEGITEIKDYTFNNCSRLSNIVIPDGITHIGNNAFSACGSLSSVTISDTVKSIGDLAFSSCSNLSTLILGAQLESMGNSALNACTKLKTIVLPDSLKTIGSRTFFLCKELTSVTLSKSLTSIGREAFGDCNKLEEFKIEDNDFFFVIDGVLYGGELDEDAALYTYPVAKKGATLNIPDGITRVIECASIHLEEVTFPSSVKRIDDKAFAASDASSGKLKTVVLNEGLEFIGEQAFSACRALVNIELPSTLLEIKGKAFINCVKIESVVVPSGIETLEEYVFDNCASLKEISLPEGLRSIKGNSIHGTAIEHLIIPSTVNSIGAEAFVECRNLKSIIIPASVTTIGIQIFKLASNVTIFVEEVTSKPAGWHVDWNIDHVNYPSRPVFWGCTLDSNKTYVVSFTINADSISETQQTTFVRSEPYREGYTFGGWTDDGGNTTYAMDELDNIEYGTVLTAIWNKD